MDLILFNINPERIRSCIKEESMGGIEDMKGREMEEMEEIKEREQMMCYLLT